jgi:O-antigen/teichoic acid export membrane protein
MALADLMNRAMQSTRVGKEFLWVILGQTLAGLGGLAGVKMLTRAMSPTAYGEFSLALTGAIVAQQCVGGPLGQAAMRFYTASREEGCTSAYFRALHRLMAKGSGLLLGAGILVFIACLFSGHTEKTSWIALTVVLAVATGYNIVFDAIQSGSRNRAVVAFHQAALQWLRPLAALALFALVSSGLSSALWGYVAATLLVIGSQTAFLVRLVKPSHTRSAAPPARGMERKLLDYAWPFASWGLLAWGQMASDRWFLEIFRDAPSVAAYTVCYQLGYYPMILVSTAISNLAAPIVFEIAGAGTENARLDAASQANRMHIQALVVLTVVVTTVFALFHSSIFRLLTTSTYAPYSPYVPVLAASAGIFAIAQAASLVFLISARSAELTSAKCLPAIAGLVLNMAGAYWFGVAGAVAATLLFSLIYLGAVWRLVRNAAPREEAPRPVISEWRDKQVAEG